ncbi:MAG: MatE family transporter [Phycisphaerales bacterium]|nr:MatE family transporter [Phycisphaerales bacterium]
MPGTLDDPNSAGLAGPAVPAAAVRPLVELLTLAVPTIAQMASYTVAQFIDTYMLSHVGDLPATAVGQASLVSFTFVSFGVGVMMMVNALVSQSVGRGDLAACGQFLWQGVWVGLGLGVLAVPLALGGGSIFAALGHPPELARLEATFFAITVSFAGLKLVEVALGQFLLAIGRPNVVLVAAVAGVLCMIAFNYTFIYGHFGMPRLGVAGAAWGLNLAVLVEGGVLAGFIALAGVGKRFNVADWRPRWQQLKLLLVTGIPSGAQVVSEVAAWALFTVWVIGRFPPDVMAANTYTFRYMSVSFMPAFGLSTAVTALVGRYVGMGRPDVAVRRAHLGFAVAAVYMLACGLLFLFARRWLMNVFTDDPAVVAAGGTLLVFAAVYQCFDAMYIVYNGGLRGAGDTFVPAVVVGTMCWAVVIGGGYLMARFAPGLGVAGPWVAASAYGACVGVFLFARFTRGRWRTIRLDRDGASDTLPGSERVAPAVG